MQTAPPDSPAFPAVRAQLVPRAPEETKEVGEKRVTPGRTAWGSLASPAPLVPRALWSMCRSRKVRWPECQDLRAGLVLLAFLDLPDRKVTWVPEASRVPLDPRVRRGSRVLSLVQMAGH